MHHEKMATAANALSGETSDTGTRLHPVGVPLPNRGYVLGLQFRWEGTRKVQTLWVLEVLPTNSLPLAFSTCSDYSTSVQASAHDRGEIKAQVEGAGVGGSERQANRSRKGDRGRPRKWPGLVHSDVKAFVRCALRHPRRQSTGERRRGSPGRNPMAVDTSSCSWGKTDQTDLNGI